MNSFTYEQLSGRSSDLLPLFRGKGEVPVIFANDGHEDFQADIDGLLKKIREKSSDIEIYQLCKLTSKDIGQPTYFSLYDFRTTDTGWETSLHDAAKADRRNTYQSFRERNLPFLRIYMMGDSTKFIRCHLTDQQIDSWAFATGVPINVWEQHHFKVRNRTSVQKEDADPGEILRRMDFSNATGETVEAIKDMMRTIFLSPTAHKAVHNSWNDSDIDNYSIDQRPWALRNQNNWDFWMTYLESHGYDQTLFGSFDTWIASLRH